MPGKVHLVVDKDVDPHKAGTRVKPLSVKDKFIAEVEDLVEQGLIEKVTEPTDWLSAPLLVNKPAANNNIRLCMDSRPLNKALKRTEYPMPTLDQLLLKLNGVRVFPVAGVKSGYWHLELDKESSNLTTFNTPLGRMKWLRLPFGLKIAPEEFQRKLNEYLEGL